jgi:two-component system response regulator YesN
MYSLVIVDDEEEILEGMRQMKEWGRMGFFVSATFSDPQEAISYCLSHPVDVMLTDIRMSGVSGLSLIKRLQEQCPHPPLFCIMSAYSEFSYAQEAIRLGVKSYLVKPSSLQEIKQTFCCLKQELDKRLHTTSQPVHSSTNQLIQQALRIIQSQPDNCSLKTISVRLGVNISYLSRLFKEETHENFSEYVKRVKMDMATTLLRDAITYSNTQLARMLGYRETQNFIRVFKTRFGMPPQEYRKRNHAT